VNAYRADADPLEALGDATRRQIIEGLRDGERTVGDLAAGLPVSRPAVSQHLGVLRAAGLVLERPQGTRRYYRLDPTGLVRLQHRLDAMWGLEEAPVGGPPAGEAAPAAAIPASEPGPEAVAPEAAVLEPAPAAREKGRKKRKKKGGRK
jgi:DNA-binding transcriptional ArsR family regulator